MGRHRKEVFEDVPIPSNDQIEKMLGETVVERPRKNVVPIQQIIEEFWSAVTNHPDVKMMTCSLGGKPPENMIFPGVPTRKQHAMEIRFVYKETASFMEQEQRDLSPYGPGGKYEKLIPKKDDKPTEEVVDEQEHSWDHLIQKRAEKPELETASV